MARNRQCMGRRYLSTNVSVTGILVAASLIATCARAWGKFKTMRQIPSSLWLLHGNLALCKYLYTMTSLTYQPWTPICRDLSLCIGIACSGCVLRTYLVKWIPTTTTSTDLPVQSSLPLSRGYEYVHVPWTILFTWNIHYLMTAWVKTGWSFDR